MIDRVLADLGLLRGDASSEAFDLLVNEFRNFLLVGSIRWEDWTRFSDVTKLAAIKAGRAHQAEQACLQAKAQLGEDDHLEVYSVVDGGQVACESHLTDIVDELTSAINAECDEHLATAQTTQVFAD